MVVVRDASCRRLAEGRYIMRRPGDKPKLVEVYEDEHVDQWIRRIGVAGKCEGVQRVDELAKDVTFHRVDESLDNVDQIEDTINGPSLTEIDALLGEANRYRGELRGIEQTLCDLLGCTLGDGSPMSDAVMSAVRDGVGSSIELLSESIEP